MESYVEHTNISVTNVDEAIRYFTTAMPEFRVRHDSGPGPKRWVHLGTDTTYISINQMADPAEGRFQYRSPGYNHVGFVVADAEAVLARMVAAGYKEGYVAEKHPHRRRVYIVDHDGMEFEFIQYYSADFAERNDYVI